MIPEIKNRRLKYFIVNRSLCQVLFLVLALGWPQYANTQNAKGESHKGIVTNRPKEIEKKLHGEFSKQPKRPNRKAQSNFVNPSMNVSNAIPFGPKMPTWGGHSPPIITEGPDSSIWMEFALDWTSCQIHRVDTDSAIVMILSGSISSSNSIFWNLNTISPLPGGLPHLYFIEDVLGRTGPQYGADLPLTWEISVNGGPFDPIPIQPDSSLSVNFLPGSHTFQVRITGIPQYYQADGYYKLTLEQSLVPQL